MPNGARLHEGFAGVDIMVVLDLYVAESTQHAVYIVPVTIALERGDMNKCFMNQMVQPFVQYVAAVIPPVGQARGGSYILRGPCERMGRASVFENANSFEMANAALKAGVERRDGCHSRRSRPTRTA